MLLLLYGFTFLNYAIRNQITVCVILETEYNGSKHKKQAQHRSRLNFYIHI